MKLQFLWIGKTRKAAVKELADDYIERVKKFARVEIIELRDRDEAGSDRAKILDKEAEEILRRLEAGEFVVVLDEKGRQFDSLQLAEFFAGHRNAGTRQITFVLGGHYGLAERIKKRGDVVLSLSRLTLPHELARVFLLEQVYRAFAILHSLPYQK
ncbi:MAG: 23S rRNA (pseudouridine(1915)-N(3))-methyltransferase RlmH [Acidobacteria bacterium]|nr:23S rRNA (pseudouridine(1915)-N(3))-methyltransferase RlmH [Acidobacteriota bacterium]